MTRAHWSLMIQAGISLALFAVLIQRVPAHTVAEAFHRVRPSTLTAALGLVLLGYLGRARRWSALLAHSGIELSSTSSYLLTLLGTFYGVVTPGRVGEFARVIHLSGSGQRALPSVIWDRVADVLLLELLCVPAFLFVPAWRGTLLGIYAVMVLVTLAGIAVLAQPAAARGLAQRVPSLRSAVAQWSATTGNVATLRSLGQSLAWGAFFYVFMYAAAWLLLRDLAPGTSNLLLLGLPVIPLLGNLPIAFGGLGLREQVSAAVFGQVGAGAATGAAFSLLLFSVATLLPGVLGLLASFAPWWREDAKAARP